MNNKIYDNIKKRFFEIVKENNLLNKSVIIKAKVLTPEEAIGNPDRMDFPILTGKERIIEGTFENTKSQVFTDMPGDYKDTLNNILNKEIKNNFHRSILLLAINCVLKYLNLIEGTIHCKDNEPEKCADDLLKMLKENYKNTDKIALIGFQPAFIEKLSKHYSLTVLDLNKENFGIKYNAKILDGKLHTNEAIKHSDLTLSTGTVFTNGTIVNIMQYIPINDIIFYGVTVSGASHLLNLKRICFHSI